MAEERMDLNDVLRRVQKLIAIAEHENTSPEEAQAAQLKADQLMIDYKIQEDMLDRRRPAADRMKPKWIEVPLIADWDLMGYVAHLAGEVARHCDCRIRNYTSSSAGAYNSKVYGFESDLRYFEILYTTLRLHMVGALRPGIDPGKTIEENTYTLHHSGLNWFDIAKMYGWRGPVTPEPGEPKLMYENTKTGERLSWSRAIAQYKRAYKRYVEEHNEAALHVSPSGVKTFQRSAADGYTNRISQRLREIRTNNPTGSALALRVDMVDALFREENEDLFKPAKDSGGKGRRVRYVARPFNADAYSSGVRQANTANLNPAASQGSKKEIR